MSKFRLKQNKEKLYKIIRKFYLPPTLNVYHCVFKSCSDGNKIVYGRLLLQYTLMLACCNVDHKLVVGNHVNYKKKTFLVGNSYL